MIIKYGNKGEEVRQVQRALIALGFNIAEDGIFGKATEAAVKEFQHQNNLNSDGIVGPITLKALGIENNIVFSKEETEIPQIIKKQIQEYLILLKEKNDTLLEKYQDALVKFSVTMQYASIEEANSDLLGVMFSDLFECAINKLLVPAGELFMPLLSQMKSFYTDVRGELDRAAKARIDHSIGDWIKNQIDILDKVRSSFNPNIFKEEMKLRYLESDNREDYYENLVNCIEKLRNMILPSSQELEKELYEKWINASFHGRDDSSPGCIEIRIRLEDKVIVEACTVDCPEGDKIADALNRLSNLNSVFELKVRKRVCFYASNLTYGGKSWSCGWLDFNNEVIAKPILSEAQKAFSDTEWRNVRKFFH